jgi:selenide,water dikinase
LDQALAGLPRVYNPDVLVGFDTSDDAGVYRLSATCALVQTVDFFTPIVDDPYTFGAIAAVNALSDVYAMGGRPLTALSICAYPGRGDIDDLRAIMRGGAEKMTEAGCALVGGHSVNDDEIKFGYSVTGLVHPDKVLTNAGVRVGDVLVLTKAIGTGVISTALKRGIASDEDVAAFIESMLTLNRAACEAVDGLDVRGCTDITGFGLMGHGREVAIASGVTLDIKASAVRFLPGAVRYAEAGAVPGGLNNNRDFAGGCVAVDGDVPQAVEALLYDPQTAGGLLIGVAEHDLSTLLARYPAAFVIGRAVERRDKPIHIS